MKPATKRFFTFSWTLVLLWLFARLVLPVLLPFLLGAGLALASEKAVRFLCEKGRLPRALASAVGVAATVAGVLAIAILLGALLLRQVAHLGSWLPWLTATITQGAGLLQRWLLSLGSHFPPALWESYRSGLTELFSGGNAWLQRLSALALGTAGAMLSGLPDKAIFLGTGLLSAFLISARLPKLRALLESRFSEQALARWYARGRHLIQGCLSWLSAQVRLTLVTFCVLLPGFLLLRVSRAPLIAALVCLVDALPVLGTGTVMLPWSLVCLLSHDGGRALGLLGLYLTAATLRSLLEPRILGRKLGLDPLATLIAMYCGFRLWGLLGMLLLPLLTASAAEISKESC